MALVPRPEAQLVAVAPQPLLTPARLPVALRREVPLQPVTIEKVNENSHLVVSAVRHNGGAIWSDRNVEVAFWNVVNAYKTEMRKDTDAETLHWFSQLFLSLRGPVWFTESRGLSFQEMLTHFLSARVMEHVELLREAVLSNDELSVATFGPRCIEYRRLAHQALEQVKLWLHRQMVLRELALPHKLDDWSGYQATKLTDRLYALEENVHAYRVWLRTPQTHAPPATPVIPEPAPDGLYYVTMGPYRMVDNASDGRPVLVEANDPACPFRIVTHAKEPVHLLLQ
ncbi:hypothetical protein AURDEDRAFT_183358 [Auricularia subglabra TFB-10046 SS5]|nr:hypothetical protein AURDEDRAFT_183358 [Auricularia subglabra TFB-10046 SS5]